VANLKSKEDDSVLWFYYSLPDKNVLIPFHENLDTVQPLIFLAPCLPKCIKLKVKWYEWGIMRSEAVPY
jgi:hypothetical protein